MNKTIKIIICILSAATMLVGILQAQTTVEGFIKNNTTWTQAGSPYMITGDVYIERNLTITSGTEIVFTKNYFLMVMETLDVKGDAGNPVVFRGLEVSGANVVWSGILPMHSRVLINIDNAEFHHAHSAINFSATDYSGQFNVPEITVTNTLFENNITAFTGTRQKLTSNFSHCTFTNNQIAFDDMGLHSSTEPAFITPNTRLNDCFFSRNNIAVSRAAVIEHCVFENNRLATIIERGTVQFCTFLNNDTAFAGHSSNFNYNTINNSTLGAWAIPIYNKGFSSPMFMRRNHFGFNKTAVLLDTGINLGAVECNRFAWNRSAVRTTPYYYRFGAISSDSFSIRNNTFKFNDTAIVITPQTQQWVLPSDSTKIFMRFLVNLLDSNRLYNIVNLSPVSFDMLHSYLGPDSGAIESMMYDGIDKKGMGFINYGIPSQTSFDPWNYTVIYNKHILKADTGVAVKPIGLTVLGIVCVPATLATPEPEPEKKYAVYPNPFTSHIVIEYKETDMPLTATLYDTKGTRVQQQQATQDDAAAGKLTIDTDGLAQGIYLLHIVTEHTVYKAKLVK